MRTVAAEVARGCWVHIFPEGKVNYTGRVGPLRWGVGKLVCDARARSDRSARLPRGAGLLPFVVAGRRCLVPALALRGSAARIRHVALLQGPRCAAVLPQRHGRGDAQAQAGAAGGQRGQGGGGAASGPV